MEKKEDLDLSDKKEKKVKTVAEKIWEEIKDISLPMFALPNQTVERYCTPITVQPDKLYLTSTVGSILPTLEDALGNKYNIELVQKYITISKK